MPIIARLVLRIIKPANVFTKRSIAFFRFCKLSLILSRKRLISCAIIDGVLFICLYYRLFLTQFYIGPHFHTQLLVFLTIWMLCSYVFKQYKRRPDYSLAVIEPHS